MKKFCDKILQLSTTYEHENQLVIEINKRSINQRGCQLLIPNDISL